MKKNSIRNVLIFGAITLISIMAIQIYSLKEAWKLRDEHFDQRVRVALQGVAERVVNMNEGTLPAKNLIHRKSSNYYLVNVENIIDANALEYFLHDELSRVSLNLDFEYAVFDCFSKEMVYGNYCKVEDNEIHKQSYQLPKYEDFLYYFGVRFPTKATYIFSGLTRYFMTSFLIIFTLGFFIYATYILLTQKRITEMQRDFINNMTHEFKTPLSSIRISSEVLAKSDKVNSDDRLAQYVSIIQSQEKRLNNQVERVLKIASIEKRNLKLKKDEVDLNELVRELALSRKAEVENNGGKIGTEYKKNIIVMADELHLTNVLYNLLDNAIKYSNLPIDIHIKTDIENGTPVFYIIDHGIGMSKSELQNIGEKFYRVSKGDIHDVKGFGLGLYYVNLICKFHGWDLDIESKLDEGTTVKIQFNN